MSRFYNLDQAPFNSRELSKAIVAAIAGQYNGAFFDAQDMSTMYRDAAGTVPVTAMEQPVGLWLDKSGRGNHAMQSITASRPVVSARKNLLTKTENFADSAWVKRGTATLGGVAPDGTGRLISGLTSSGNDIYQYASLPTGAQGAPQIEIWPVTTTGVLRLLNPANYLNGLFDIDLTKLTQNTWNKISQSHPSVTTVNGFSGVGGSAGIHLYGKDGLSVSAYFRFPQLEYGPSATRYQRVNTATDYDTVGFPVYLTTDGVDDHALLPFLGLYANGSASVISATSMLTQASNACVVSEGNSADNDTVYCMARQLASGGNLDSTIIRDDATTLLDTTGSASALADGIISIRSSVDTGSNVKLFKNGQQLSSDDYTRSGTVTLNNTTIGAKVGTSVSMYSRMRLYGLIITKSALSDADRRKCEVYLGRKAGVQL